MDAETEIFSPMEDKSVLGQPKILNVSQENDGRTISVHVLEFKTSLLEAVEELHLCRDAAKRHEEQICKLVLEKQELEWQTESLQNKISRMSNENAESLAAVKKHFQAQIRKLEGEKGKIQLASELKEKEISSLKEELKLLQLLRYSLEKKLAELEQKLQLQTQLKDSHLSQLGEVERRFGTISKQCAVVKQAHEKLEQNVEVAMRINEKLTSINGKQETTIKALKKDVLRLNKEVVTLKVSSVCISGDEHFQSVLKEQQLQQFQQKLLVETELNKKLRNEITTERAEKQELLTSLHHTERLLQTQTEALSRAEQKLLTLQEKYQALKAEHEFNQERTREEQDSYAQIKDEYQNSKLVWEKKMLQLQKVTEEEEVELKAVKKAYNHLHEENKRLSAFVDHKTEAIQNSQIGLKDQETQTLEMFPSRTGTDINLVKLGSLHKDDFLEEGLFSPHNVEPMSLLQENVPDESTADCVKNREDDESSTANISMQVDLTKVLASGGRDMLVAVSKKTSGLEEVNCMTNQLCAEIETVDKGCPSNQTQSDAELTELSVPQTRSVYEVDGEFGDPLALQPKDRPLQQNLCIPEVTKPQTSDKHTDSQRCATSEETKTDFEHQAAPEILKNLSKTEDQLNIERPQEDQTYDTCTHVTENGIADQPSPCQEATQQEIKPKVESIDQISPPELIYGHSQSCALQKDSSAETNLAKLKQLPPAQCILQSDSMEKSEKKEQNVDCSFASCTHTFEVQQSEVDVSSKVGFDKPDATNPNQDSYGCLKAAEQSDADHKCPTVVGPSNHAGYKRHRSSFGWDSVTKNKMNMQKGVDRNLDHALLTRNNKPILALTPSTTSQSDLRFGFPNAEFVPPFCARFTKKALVKTTNILPHPKSDSRGEWNAIKQSFSELFTEKDTRVHIPYTSIGSPASSCVGNGPKQDATLTVFPPKLQSLEIETQTMDDGVALNSVGKEQSQSDIMVQLSEFNGMMLSEGLSPHKIRKID